jgi:parvulin-like peptidyl-prolyl isomerase
MAKSSKTEARLQEETRKQAVERRKYAEMNRRIWIGLAIVGVLIFGLLAAAVIQELVIKPRAPIAEVNGARISSAEYAKRVKFDWFQNQDQASDPQGSSLQVLDQMVDEALIREQAQQRGLTVTEEEVNERIEQFFGYQRVPPTPAPTATPDPSATPSTEPTATPFPTPTPVTLEAYQKELKDYVERLGSNTEMTEADFRSLVAFDMLRQKLIDDVTKDVPTTEEQVHARHILVRTIAPAPTATPVPEGQPAPTPDPAATATPAPRTEEQALARAIEVKQKLDAGGDFAALALEYSDDTGSAAQGGDLGWFGRGMMIKEFDDAVFAMQPGEVSNPIKTSFGYHIIKVDERDPARQMESYMLQQKQSEAFNTWLEGVRNAAKIERNWTLEKVPPTPGASQG